MLVNALYAKDPVTAILCWESIRLADHLFEVGPDIIHSTGPNTCALGRWLGSEVDIYRQNQNMISIVAIQPNVILGRQYLCPLEIEPSIFIC
jgi:hypothetical protein